MSDEILNELLKEYSKTHHKMADECKSIDEQIVILQTCRKTLTKPWEEILNDVESKIQLIMSDRKSSFKSDYGKIIYTRAGVRRSWNLDALDMICNSNPIVKQFIWALRKEEPFDARISIKVD